MAKGVMDSWVNIDKFAYYCISNFLISLMLVIFHSMAYFLSLWYLSLHDWTIVNPSYYDDDLEYLYSS